MIKPVLPYKKVQINKKKTLFTDSLCFKDHHEISTKAKNNMSRLAKKFSQ